MSDAVTNALIAGIVQLVLAGFATAALWFKMQMEFRASRRKGRRTHRLVKADLDTTRRAAGKTAKLVEQVKVVSEQTNGTMAEALAKIADLERQLALAHGPPRLAPDTDKEPPGPA